MAAAAFGARSLLGVVLLIAATAKLRHGRGRFMRAILGYDLVPAWVAAILARWLPWIELATGTLLVIGLLLPIVATIAFALLLVFTTAIAHSLHWGMTHDCGCTGRPTPIQWRLAVRNVALMALAIVVYAGAGMAPFDSFTGSAVVPPLSLDPLTAALLVAWAGTGVILLVLRLRARSSATVSVENVGQGEVQTVMLMQAKGGDAVTEQQRIGRESIGFARGNKS